MFFVISSKAFSGIISGGKREKIKLGHGTNHPGRLFVFSPTTPDSVCLHSRWWLTMQCAASSLSKGTSNKAWWNSSSFAVGRLLGSISRHFWINSWIKTKPQRVVLSYGSLLQTAVLVLHLRLTLLSPVATGPLMTEWHCLWLLGTHKTNLHYSGFPTQPSEGERGQRRREEGRFPQRDE